MAVVNKQKTRAKVHNAHKFFPYCNVHNDRHTMEKSTINNSTTLYGHKIRLIRFLHYFSMPTLFTFTIWEAPTSLPFCHVLKPFLQHGIHEIKYKSGIYRQPQMHSARLFENINNFCIEMHVRGLMR